MKIPFLIICLAVVYGACQTYGHKESIDLTEKIQNGGDYKLDYANTVLERSLSKHKRANLLSPVTTSIDLILGFDNGIRSTTISSMKDIFGVTLRQKDSKVEKYSLIEAISSAIKTIVSYIFQGITTPISALMDTIFEIDTEFLKYILLLFLHKSLNVIDETFITKIFPQLGATIEAFNVLYELLRLVEYIP